MDCRDDPYEILGLTREATETEIKKAYRKLALKNHPDKQNSEEEREKANETFAKISNAYQILSDETLRKKFDNRKKKDAPSSPSPRSTSPRPTRTRYYRVPKEESESEFTVKPPHGSSSRKKSGSSRTSTTRGGLRRDDGSFSSFGSNTSFTCSSENFDESNFEDPFEIFRQMFPDFGEFTEVDSSATRAPLRKSRRGGHVVSSPGFSERPTLSRRTPNSSSRRRIGSRSPGRRMRRIPILDKDNLREARDNPVVSVSTKTRQVTNADGSIETITEITKKFADGSTSTQRDVSRSSAAASTTSYKTSSSQPMRLQSRQAPSGIKGLGPSSSNQRSPRTKRTTIALCN